MRTPSAARSCQPRAAAELPCWCGSGPWTESFRTRRFGLLRCTGCGSYRIDPPPITSAGESEEFYTGYYRDGGAFAPVPNGHGCTRPSWFSSVAGKVPALAKAGRSVLDVGCGDGHLCEQLHRQGWEEVRGLDISKSRIERARMRYPHLRFYDCALPETDIQPGSLDLIIMEAVVEHLPEPVRILEQIRTYMATGGRVVLTTPNMESGHFRLIGRRWTGMLAPHAHIFLFTAASIKTLLRAAGLTPECAGSFHTPLYSPAEYLRRLLRGDVKGTAWRAHQEMGALYGRLVHSGPMLFAVASKGL